MGFTRAVVAQGIEHHTAFVGVVGSNPTDGTKEKWGENFRTLGSRGSRAVIFFRRLVAL